MAFNLVKGVIFFFLTGLGTVMNISVFMNYICIIGSTEKKSMHLILIHLVFTNTILLLSKGIPRTIATFGLRNFLDNIGCKIVVYLERVARGLSICTSSLLTVVQAITISPRHCGWRKLNPKSAWHIFSLFLLFWILNSLISINLFYIITNINLNSSKTGENDSYCFLPRSQKINWIFLTLFTLRDTMCQGVMGGSSVYMVFLLHRHHQRVLHLQLSKFLYKTPPEVKAAQSVLLLMFSFLFFYWTDCFLSLYLIFAFKNESITNNLQEFLILGYAILSPFVLIHRYEHRSKCWHA
ncbi:PREDICTED: vomeronasal type-1 receptor 4-like [Chinchilla lanigera]|uniref:vomeronasal type-1 receptor 4-like n=1 Tax=Chinchilla lanigera TaxID=34839 RepID=UPI00038E974F|nr:PREDICTED: vomeronasal type-1 receptor 4-like [Chinchilla lanigera]